MNKILTREEPIFDYVYFNDEIIHYNYAQIGLGATSLQYGFNVFCGIRGYHLNGDNFIFRLQDHYKRFMDAAKIMGFGVFVEYEEFEKVIFSLVKKNNITGDFYIRAFIFTPKTFLAPKAHKNAYQIAIYMQELSSKFDPNLGQKLQISSFIKYSDNSISTKAKVGGSYVNSLMASQHAKLSGFDDALMLNENGFICECSTSNVILTKDNIIYTPSLSDGPLQGITLRTIIEILKFNNYQVLEISLSRSLAYTCDEMITTGTALGVQKVDQIDHTLLPDNNKLFNLLYNEFEKVITNQHELSAKWMQKVR